jgi:hypothetical protein
VASRGTVGEGPVAVFDDVGVSEVRVGHDEDAVQIRFGECDIEIQ